MAGYALSEERAIPTMSVCVDFGVSQVVDGNSGAYAILPKSVVEISGFSKHRPRAASCHLENILGGAGQPPDQSR